MTKKILSARGLAKSNPDLPLTYRRALAGALQDMASGEGRASDLAIGLRSALRRCKDVLRTEMCALMRPIDPGDLVTALAAEDDPPMALPPGTDGRARLIAPVEAEGTRPLMLVALSPGPFTAQDALFHKALAQAIRDRLDRERTPVQDMAALPESQRLSKFYWQIIELTNTLLGHQGPDLDAHIHCVLARIGQLVGVERSYVYRLHPPGKISNTHEWTAPGVPLSRHIAQNLPLALLDPWKDQLHEPHTVAIEDVDALTQAERTQRFLQAQGVKASVAVPMRRNEGLDGYVGFDCTLRSRAFTPDEMRLLQTVANAIAVVLHRYDAEKEATLALSLIHI